MSKKSKAVPKQRHEMNGLERLTVDLNRPIAQAQRWVTIHRLDTGEDMAWEQAMELAAETPELDMTLNDHGSVTVRREAENAVDREDLAGEKDW